MLSSLGQPPFVSHPEGQLFHPAPQPPPQLTSSHHGALPTSVYPRSILMLPLLILPRTLNPAALHHPRNSHPGSRHQPTPRLMAIVLSLRLSNAHWWFSIHDISTQPRSGYNFLDSIPSVSAQVSHHTM